jgi:excisionase family DNA binding protein
VIELPTGAMVFEVREQARVARALRVLASLTERRNGGGGLPQELLIVLAKLERNVSAVVGPKGVAALGESVPLVAAQVNASAQVAHDAVASGSVHDLDASEAAQMIGCTTANVTDLARRGTLRGRKVGRAWRFHVEDVHEYAEGRR